MNNGEKVGLKELQLSVKQEGNKMFYLTLNSVRDILTKRRLNHDKKRLHKVC